ncbi:MAG: hypothetical protein JO271_17450 [Verrucomicrobia bacterium]|nr:hypothetical protein [Verrucomicrobiota bacterium]
MDTPMFSSFLLIAGVAVLGLGLRTFRTPICQRLSILCLLFASFLVGYLPSGSWPVGVLFVAFWIFLPWVGIITRVRKLRLPIERIFSESRPPRDELFPFLNLLTDEIEAQDFALADDVACDWQYQRQFIRLFHRNSDQSQMAICLIHQNHFAFCYVYLVTRSRTGKVFLTWNYPFAYSLKFLPNTRVQRVRPDFSIKQICQAHHIMLGKEHVDETDVLPLEPEQMRELLEQDLKAQIDHNVRSGLLTPAGDHQVRYTWRGMVYLWSRFLLDFVRMT